MKEDCVDRIGGTGSGIGHKLVTEVLTPMKAAFVGKDEVIDLLGICLAGGENLFILGPPGTAKSALVHELARRIEGRVFDYLLTRFTEPNELFGPFDIRKLREGELVTNTEGMLPEASLVFLDELLNANSAILNSLLMVLNERIFRRGRETRKLPLLMVVAASNRLPEDDALAALFDRFLLRVHCDNVGDERLADVLEAGWQLDSGRLERQFGLSVEDLRQLQQHLPDVDVTAVRSEYVDVVQKLRKAGIPVSDRRAVKLQRLVAASALICGRMQANCTDLWVLRYIWDTDEQREIIAAIVQPAVERDDAQSQAASHPRSRGQDAPNADELARDLQRLEQRWAADGQQPQERSVLRDQLGLLAGRCQWLADAQQRTFLEGRMETLLRAWGDET
ncbi:MAG TPA: AAA family ATPase [Pirellulales bacterium]|jgi:MoxR-like ATPase|nr:AAA family ATPase [Pirellulales bacterium]